MKKFNHKLVWLAPLLMVAGHAAFAAGTVMATINKQNILGNLSSGALQSSSNAGSTSLSSNGSIVAFHSSAFNFVGGDGNRSSDVFIKSGGKLFTRISVDSLGKEARNTAVTDWYNNPTRAHSFIGKQAITPDGKFVVFHSEANNLADPALGGDPNNDFNANPAKHWDVFLRDVAKKKTYKLSGIMAGASNPALKNDAPWEITTHANHASTHAAIAGTAKQAWVVFESRATNLISGFTPTSDRRNVYLLDLKTKKLELISAVHDANGNPTAEAVDAAANNPTAPVDCYNASISSDGRFVSFQSDATNLVNVGTGNSNRDVFIYDRIKFKMYQLSGTAGGVSGTGGFTINAEGNDDSSNPYIAGGAVKDKTYLIAYDSKATLPDLLPAGGAQVGDMGNDSDVYVVKFAPMTPSDPNSLFEIKEEKRISVFTNGTLVPVEEASNKFDNTKASNTNPVVSGNSTAYSVAFRSSADNLLYNPDNVFWKIDSNDTTDVYVYDGKTALFDRANVDSGHEEGTVNVEQVTPSISPEGRVVGFSSSDPYLVPFFGDNGSRAQVFLRTR